MERRRPGQGAPAGRAAVRGGAVPASAALD